MHIYFRPEQHAAMTFASGCDMTSIGYTHTTYGFLETPAMYEVTVSTNKHKGIKTKDPIMIVQGILLPATST